jgi:hypothetical protein
MTVIADRIRSRRQAAERRHKGDIRTRFTDARSLPDPASRACSHCRLLADFIEDTGPDQTEDRVETVGFRR